MKTTEDWIKEIPIDKLVDALTTREEFWWSASGEIELWELRLRATKLRFENLVNQIQLDAFKAGMTEAASICVEQANKHDMDYCGQMECSKAILTARDNKK